MVTERRPLWEWRATRRLSKTALAQAAGVSRNTIADIESGKHLPKLETMREIAAVFEIGLDAVDWEAGKRERSSAPRNKGQRRGPRRPKEEE